MWLIRLIAGMLENNIMLSCLISWFLAQTCKVIVSSVKQKRIDLSNMFRTGGMPSSHAAVVCSLMAAIYLQEGMTSLFVLSLLFAIVVIHDSITLRQTVSRQTKVLKELAKSSRLKERWDFRGVSGHTSLQALAGVILGIAVSILVHFLRPL